MYAFSAAASLPPPKRTGRTSRRTRSASSSLESSWRGPRAVGQRHPEGVGAAPWTARARGHADLGRVPADFRDVGEADIQGTEGVA